MGDFQIKNEIIRLDFRGLENEVENANWYRSLCQLNNNQHLLVCESWGSMGKEEECRWCGYDNYQKHDPPLLFDLSIDMTERLDIASEHPETIERIHQAIERHQQSLVDEQ